MVIRQQVADDFSQPTTDTGRPLPLSAAHLAELRASGLSDATIRAAGLYTEGDPAKVARLLNWTGGAEKLGPCLVFPLLDAAGNPTGEAFQLKPTTPRVKSGRVVKYETPFGRSPHRVYVPPGVHAKLADVAVPLLITEGAKKALAAAQAGFACVALAGVENWSPPGRKGRTAGRSAPADWSRT